MLEIKDKSVLLTTKFGGKGGKESQIMALFPTLSRINKRKFDFVCSEYSTVYEAKKQQN